jgi:hypothetical protein
MIWPPMVSSIATYDYYHSASDSQFQIIYMLYHHSLYFKQVYNTCKGFSYPNSHFQIYTTI